MKNFFIFPDGPFVREIFDYITNGDLDKLRRTLKLMPPKYVLQVRHIGYSMLHFAVDSRRRDIV